MKENYYTLDSLTKKQQQLRKEMSMSHQRISNTWSQLFTPPEADTKVQRWVNQAERAVAVYDGFMMMYILFNRFSIIKSAFKKNRRYKHKS